MDRLTLREAGEALGISKEAVRKRYERGSIEGEHGEDGIIYVYVDMSVPAGEDAPNPDKERVARLEAEVEYLRDQLEDEKRAHRESNRENRQIIAGFVSRLPELEAPRETPLGDAGGPQTASEDSSRGEAPGEANTATQPRPWWRRIFGGGG